MIWDYYPAGLSPASWETERNGYAASVTDTADLVGPEDVHAPERWGWVVYCPKGETIDHGGAPGLSDALQAAERKLEEVDA